MNTYLTKIAEKLPYRARVEVVIRKDDKVLIMKCKNPDTGDQWYAFPGGGVDDQTESEAAENECLEEVGIKVKNLKKTNITFKEQGGLGKKDDRHLKFRGSETRWYVADYDQMDKSKLGDDGDSRKYRWRSLSEALQDVKSARSIATQREKVLTSLKGSNRFLDKVASELEDRFQPDLSPSEMRQLGVLAKQYFHKDPGEANYFHVDASMSEWPKKWIDPKTAPMGWFDWYQGYSAGKRTPDDERQIKRWISFKARHLAQLTKADPTLSDLSVQPRRRQALLNWGIAPGIDKSKL
jgi:8-oxo-dGTP pyrophosphatase MutT (NUDIX family)